MPIRYRIARSSSITNPIENELTNIQIDVLFCRRWDTKSDDF